MYPKISHKLLSVVDGVARFETTVTVPGSLDYVSGKIDFSFENKESDDELRARLISGLRVPYEPDALGRPDN